MKKSLKKGFTLVELVIVIAVIAILSAVLIPTFGNVIQNSKNTAAYQNASNALNGYITNQAEQEQSASLSAGYIVVFTSAQEYKEGTTAQFDLDDTVYIFEYDGNSVNKIDGKFVKGTSSAKVSITGLKAEKTENAATYSKWTTTESVTAIPLNYKFTANGVSASVWWVKTNPVGTTGA